MGRWQTHWQQFIAQAPPPWWGPGLRLDGAIRATYNQYLPINAYLRDLERLFRLFLPGSWIPDDLRSRRFLSVPDFWHSLPTRFHTLCPSPEDLFPLACALASPARFGHAAERYSEQLPLLLAAVAQIKKSSPLILDLGCGVGLDTYACAAHLAAHDLSACVLGITREPLEVWMAVNRQLPHVGQEEQAFPPESDACPVSFAVGDLFSVSLRRRADIIICNGLLGGPALYRRKHLQQAWNCLIRLAAPGALLMAGNRFHAGRDSFIQDFIALGRTISEPLMYEKTLLFQLNTREAKKNGI